MVTPAQSCRGDNDEFGNKGVKVTLRRILGDLGVLCGGLLSQGFHLGSQAVAAPDALRLGVGAQVGRFPFVMSLWQ